MVRGSGLKVWGVGLCVRASIGTAESIGSCTRVVRWFAACYLLNILAMHVSLQEVEIGGDQFSELGGDGGD